MNMSLMYGGKVRRRLDGADNPNLATGEIEVLCHKMIILNKSKTPPFYIEDGVVVDEMLRLRYRYLDLRRPEMQDALRLRHKVTIAMRHFLDNEGFYEIETPILCKSSPEGARDYLVPIQGTSWKLLCAPTKSPAIQADFNGSWH